MVTRGQPVRGLLEGCARMERSVSYGGIVDKIVNTSIGWSSLCMHNPRLSLPQSCVVRAIPLVEDSPL